ncbi:unnamed protein product [Brassica oleracea var. botrytis]
MNSNLRLSEGYFPSHLTTISLELLVQNVIQIKFNFQPSLLGCRFTEDPMPILEKLLHLKVVALWIESFCGSRMVCSRDGFPQLQKLEFDGLKEWEEWIVEEGVMPLLHTLCIEKSFCGRRMVCSKGGFPQLQKLDFYRLEEWEELIVEEGSMPLLHTLTIDSCPKLKELPDGLRFITSLKSLAFYNMGKRWEKRLSNGGKDYYKVQHIPYVIIR